MEQEGRDQVVEFLKFKPHDVCKVSEEQTRIDNSKSPLVFGIPFLDDVFGGIIRNDVVLLGAKSGRGKSQLAMTIAKANAMNGKNVCYISLEEPEDEISRRMKYQHMANLFFRQRIVDRQVANLNYTDWYMCKYGDKLKQLEDQAMKEITFPNLFIKTADDVNYTIKDLERDYLGLKEYADLIIIDHLHYFDCETENENKEMKDILKSMRHLALYGKVPILLIAHVRKSDKRLKQIVPDLEDFHGSSDISKIATKAIMIAPDFNSPQNKDKRMTYMSILKNRLDGSSVDTVASIAYDLNAQNYDDQYVIGKISGDGQEFLESDKKDVNQRLKRNANIEKPYNEKKDYHKQNDR